MEKILYVRNGPYKVNPNLYNLQEIGFCKALCNKGIDCDIVYYSDEDKDEIIYRDELTGKEIKLLWRKGYKILRTGFYPLLLKKEFANKYDLIITTEYSQIMSLLWTRYNPKVVLYNGPYYNMFKIPFTEKIYDLLFVKKLNSRLDKVFVKSELSKKYLENKGFQDVVTLGVGLDTDVFKVNDEIDSKTSELREFMKKNNCILYIGSLIERKNFKFTLDIFNKVIKSNPDVKLVVIGTGKKSYIQKSMKVLDNNALKNVKFVDKIDNKLLKYIYPEAKIFILPSKFEIFGMVILESMFFGTPVITSINGGSTTLIRNKKNGIVMDKFDSDIWAKEINSILNNEEYRKELSKNARANIINNFTWEKISEKLLNELNKQ